MSKIPDIFVDVLLTSSNHSVEKSDFSSSLKTDNITPVFQKGDRTSKDNYRLITLLPDMSEIFEPCIFPQL